MSLAEGRYAATLAHQKQVRAAYEFAQARLAAGPTHPSYPPPRAVASEPPPPPAPSASFFTTPAVQPRPAMAVPPPPRRPGDNRVYDLIAPGVAIVGAVSALREAAPAHPPALKAKASPPPASVGAEPAPSSPASGGGASFAYCDVLNAEAPAGTCEAARQMNARVAAGVAHAKVPATMVKDSVTQVTLALGAPGQADQDARASLAPVPGDPVNFPARIGRRMRAELIGVGFNIVLPAPQTATQDIGDGVGSWTWQVTPTIPGPNQILTLKSEVIFTDGQGHDSVLSPTVKTYSVQVTVRPATLQERARKVVTSITDWLKTLTGMISAASGLLAALGVLLTALHLRRRKRG